ncbi:MAG: phosphosulfolactate synthase [Marinilabiliales bacterium]
MNYNLEFLPERTKKPRQCGLNMIMDKGLSLKDAESLIQSSGDFVDFVKLGFGTSIITNNLEEKIKLYKEAGIKPYFGGTLFEAFYIRKQLSGFKKYIEHFNIEVVEISDGEVNMNHNEKCELINEFSKTYTVLSEVGSKEEDKVYPVEQWVEMMQKELIAGSWKVITEARESGNLGIYNKDGSANTELINAISNNIDIDNIIWEAPIKKQQVWFIRHMGANVNLGNIPYNEVIALESLRLGLRGDTFFQFLPDSLKS